mmetsp:Transcript_16088/g.30394  ORF Transcript_16088/g.30394 Transcript_16088/m.30394 type:complete len:94 (+) Transcript_16088:143-424(+)
MIQMRYTFLDVGVDGAQPPKCACFTRPEPVNWAHKTMTEQSSTDNIFSQSFECSEWEEKWTNKSDKSRAETMVYGSFESKVLYHRHCSWSPCK